LCVGKKISSTVRQGKTSKKRKKDGSGLARNTAIPQNRKMREEKETPVWGRKEKS